MKKQLLLFALLLLPLLASADPVEIDGIYYNLNDENKTAEVTRGISGQYGEYYTYFSYSGDIVIPEKVSYGAVTYDVTSIGENAFSSCTDVISLSIPKSITSIADNALGMNSFMGSRSLTSIIVDEENPVYNSQGDCNAIIETATNTLLLGCDNTIIPSAVKHIGENAFSCTQMASIVLPEGLVSIGESAFSYCSHLSSIEIPQSVTSIGAFAFYFCGALTSSVTIPDGVSSIGERTFGETKLKAIILGSGLTTIAGDAFDKCPDIKDIYCYALAVPTVEGGFGYYADYVFGNVTLHVPASSLEAYKADEDWSAFGKIVALPSVEKVEIGGLYYNLYDEVYTAEVIRNPNWMTDNYTGAVTIPAFVQYGGKNYRVTTIADDAFSNCDITSVSIGENVTTIGDEAFQGSGIASVSIGANVTTIGKNAFYGCVNLTSVTIPAGVTYISENAFADSGVSSISFSESIKIVGEQAFHGTPWYDNQPDGLIYTGKVVYSYKGELPQNSHISFEEGTASITGHAFEDTENLISVVIPASVTFIGEQAFDRFFDWSTYTTKGCGLTDVYCYATNVPETVYEDYYTWVFPPSYISNNTTLHVPSVALTDYQSEELTWARFKSIVALTDDDPKPTTAISQIIGTGNDATAVESYSLDGKRLHQPQRGLNIVRMSNGTVKKVVVK